ncbi:hypothetical protein TNCV_4512891 [Trichonephila clavipes]|nr:hypothetical protein TNCV_4512891 [Trichonephila clavipes]
MSTPTNKTVAFGVKLNVETPLHPEKLTGWCTLWAGGIIGPYFKNDEGHKYWKMSSKIRRLDWTTSEPAVAVVCQTPYLKCNATRLSFD